jgi:hypothetical protein
METAGHQEGGLILEKVAAKVFSNSNKEAIKRN